MARRMRTTTSNESAKLHFDVAEIRQCSFIVCVRVSRDSHDRTTQKWLLDPEGNGDQSTTKVLLAPAVKRLASTCELACVLHRQPGTEPARSVLAIEFHLDPRSVGVSLVVQTDVELLLKLKKTSSSAMPSSSL